MKVLDKSSVWREAVDMKSLNNTVERWASLWSCHIPHPSAGIGLSHHWRLFFFFPLVILLVGNQLSKSELKPHGLSSMCLFFLVKAKISQAVLRLTLICMTRGYPGTGGTSSQCSFGNDLFRVSTMHQVCKGTSSVSSHMVIQKIRRLFPSCIKLMYYITWRGKVVSRVSSQTLNQDWIFKILIH